MNGVGSNITHSVNVVAMPQASGSIRAVILPASSPLVVGQALVETANWATFKTAANYYSTDGTITDVTVNYIGDTEGEAGILADGEINNFSITVTDSEANKLTFAVTPRIVVHAVPTFTGTLSPIRLAQGLGPQVYEDAQSAFTGNGLIWSVSGASNLTMQSSGFIEVDTDKTAPQSGTVIAVTATNSGGSVYATTTLEITETVLSFSGLTGGIADVENFSTIGALLSNGREIDSYRWGSTPGGSEYGGNINPAAFTAGTLYLEVVAGLTYTASVPAIDLLKFDTQPGFGAGSYVVGDSVALSEGAASPSATITVEYFRLNGVDKSGELSGLNWDSTGETAGTVTARFRAATAGQADVLSNEISVVLNPALASIPPVINSMVVGVMSGTSIPVAFDFSEDQPTPYTVHIVMVPVNATAPNSTQVAAGLDFSDASAALAVSYVVSAAGTIDVDAGAIADGTYDLYATVEDVDGHLWGDVAVGEDVIVANPASLVVQQIGLYQGNNLTEVASTFTFDLSGYVVGDEILIVFGADDYTSTATITDSNVTAAAATKISTDQGAAGSNKLSMHKYVLTTVGQASTTVRVTKLSSDNNNLIALFGVKGGSIGTGTAVSSVYRGSGSTALSGTLTPTGPENYFFVYSMSTDTAIVEGQMTFTGVSQLGSVQIADPTPINRPLVIGALARSGNSSPLAYTFNGPASGPLAVVGVAITAD